MTTNLFPYNFHTHTVYDDGRCTPLEMADAAYELGFKSLGFSGHLYDRTSASWTMNDETIPEYRRAVALAKEKYRGRMDVLCGAEADLWCPDDLSDYDFVIASVHCFKFDDGFVMVDQKPEYLTELTEKRFGGDIYSMLEAFYALEAGIADFRRCDLIGHFDYITKFNKGNALFDEQHPRYVKAWHDALDALLPLDVPFEINTSVYYRKRLDRFYPDDAIIKEIFNKGGRISITGDCHSTDNLYQGFEDAVALAKSIGFKEASVFTESGEKQVGL